MSSRRIGGDAASDVSILREWATAVGFAFTDGNNQVASSPFGFRRLVSGSRQNRPTSDGTVGAEDPVRSKVLREVQPTY
jgi:hypothetical protein